MDDKPTLTPRLHPRRIYSEALVALSRLGEFVTQSGLDHRLIDLIDIRASQLNHCGYCLDMHTKDARLAGETEERIYLLDAWREAPFYTERERVVLELTEAVTFIADRGVPDDLYQRVRQHFDEKQYMDLLLAIIAINGWNRFNVAIENLAGRYHPRTKPTPRVDIPG